MVKKPIAVFTPVNPTRPFCERLGDLHRFNIRQNRHNLFAYEEKELCLPSSLQQQGLWRGNNVIYGFNKFYLKTCCDYDYICKWDDDIILSPNILENAYKFLEDNKDFIGVGLFQEDYGNPNIILQHPRENGFLGAFQRFYVYRMNFWRLIPINEAFLEKIDPLNEETKNWPRRPGESGDPDHSFQMRLTGKKEILNVPNIHLDHRAFNQNIDEYRVMVDTVSLLWRSLYAS